MQGLLSDSQRQSLAKDHAFQFSGFCRLTQNRQQDGRAVVLHLDRRSENIQSSAFEKGIHCMADLFGGGIVDVTLQQDHAVAVGAIDCGLSDDDSQDIGEIVGIAGTGAVADFGNGHGGHRAIGRSEMGQDGRGGGREQLEIARAGQHGGPGLAEQFGRRGGGNGQNAVGAADGSGADGKRGTENLLDLEGIEANAGGDNIDDRIDGADLVEMNLIDGFVVDGGLDPAEVVEDGDGAVFGGGGNGAAVDQAPDVRKGTMGVGGWRMGMIRMVVSMVRMGMAVVVGMAVAVIIPCGGGRGTPGLEPCSGDSFTHHGFDLELYRAYRQRVQLADQIVAIDAGIQHRGDDHVPASAGETIKISDIHSCRPFLFEYDYASNGGKCKCLHSPIQPGRPVEWMK